MARLLQAAQSLKYKAALSVASYDPDDSIGAPRASDCRTFVAADGYEADARDLRKIVNGWIVLS